MWAWRGGEPKVPYGLSWFLIFWHDENVSPLPVLQNKLNDS